MLLSGNIVLMEPMETLESMETLRPLFSEGAMGLVELAVHGRIEHRIDATTEPGEVGSKHMDNLGRLDPGI